MFSFMGIWNGLNKLYNRGRSALPDMSPGGATIVDANRYAPRGAFGSIPATQDLGRAMDRYRVENPIPTAPTAASTQPIGDTGLSDYMADIKSPGYLLDRVAPTYSDKITKFMLGVTPDTTQGELDRIEANRRNVQARALAGIPETTAEQDAIMANQRQRELYGGTPGIPKAFGYNPGTPNIGPNPFDPVF